MRLVFSTGRTSRSNFRWALGHYDQLAALAGDLIRRKVMVIVATGGGVSSAQAAKAATDTIPIVFVAGTDPVAFGLVASLNRPGGNLTGVSFMLGALLAKRFELLHELVPKATVFGLLVNPNFPDTERASARSAGGGAGARRAIASSSMPAARASWRRPS